MKRLDKLEGYPHLYVREEVTVEVADTGAQHTAWIYIGGESMWGGHKSFLKLKPDSKGAYDWGGHGHAHDDAA